MSLNLKFSDITEIDLIGNEVNETRKSLEIAREEFREFYIMNKKRNYNLSLAQQQLDSEFKNFKNFVYENSKKRQQSRKKLAEEIIKLNHDSDNLQNANKNLEDLKEKIEILSKATSKNDYIRTYFLNVLNMLPQDYVKQSDNTIYGLIFKYHSLKISKGFLLREIETKPRKLEGLEKEYHDIVQNQNLELINASAILSAINEESQLYCHFVELNRERRRIILNNIQEQFFEFASILRIIHNLNKICKPNYNPNTITSFDLKLKFIQNFIEFNRSIIKKALAE